MCIARQGDLHLTLEDDETSHLASNSKYSNSNSNSNSNSKFTTTSAHSNTNSNSTIALGNTFGNTNANANTDANPDEADDYTDLDLPSTRTRLDNWIRRCNRQCLCFGFPCVLFPLLIYCSAFLHILIYISVSDVRYETLVESASSSHS